MDGSAMRKLRRACGAAAKAAYGLEDALRDFDRKGKPVTLLPLKWARRGDEWFAPSFGDAPHIYARDGRWYLDVVHGNLSHNLEGGGVYSLDKARRDGEEYYENEAKRWVGSY